MGDRVDLVLLDQPRDEVGVARVADDEARRLGNGPVEAGREIVENDDLLPGVEEAERHVAADVAGAAGDQNAHRSSFPLRTARPTPAAIRSEMPHGRSEPDLLSDSRFRTSRIQPRSTAQTQGPRKSMKKPIRKAVLPVAGLGTRFLPATKAVPKEMLTVVDRPILQYIVDEAREAGVEHFIFVTGRNKGVIEDHFDSSYELEDTLKRRGKDGAYAALMADLPPAGATSFTRQQAPLGLGHAVWCARDIVGDEPFAVLLPDMVTKPGAARRPLPRPMRRGLQRSRRQHSRGRGGLAGGDAPVRRRRRSARDHGHAFEITGMVEKPKRGTAPSNLIISGRYILQPEIFQILELVEKGAGGEVQLTDGMIQLARKQKFHGVKFDGDTYDCGSKLGFLAANIAFALEPERPRCGAERGAAQARLCAQERLSAARLGPCAGFAGGALGGKEPHEFTNRAAPYARRSARSTSNAAGSTRSTRRCGEVLQAASAPPFRRRWRRSRRRAAASSSPAWASPATSRARSRRLSPRPAHPAYLRPSGRGEPRRSRHAAERRRGARALLVGRDG